MRIFVTGATGMIGRRAVPLLLAQGHDVTAIARSRMGREALLLYGATTASPDLFDIGAMQAALCGHDIVINLATHIPRGTLRPFLPGAWRETDRIRSVASAILVDAAQRSGVQRFIQESFAPIYPGTADAWLTEGVEPRPARYNRTALDAEASAARFTASGGVGVVLRFALLYGSDDPFTEQLVTSVRRGFLPFFGAPNGYVSMLHHYDAATATVAALQVPAGVFNVADDEPLTRRQLGDAIAALIGVRPPRILPAWLARLGGSLGETIARSLRISNHKLRSASSWTPRYASVREGLAALLGATQGARLP